MPEDITRNTSPYNAIEANNTQFYSDDTIGADLDSVFWKVFAQIKVGADLSDTNDVLLQDRIALNEASIAQISEDIRTSTGSASDNALAINNRLTEIERNSWVTSSRIAESAVTSNKLGGVSVTNRAIADNAVNARTILNGSIGYSEIASSAIGSNNDHLLGTSQKLATTSGVQAAVSSVVTNSVLDIALITGTQTYTVPADASAIEIIAKGAGGTGIQVSRNPRQNGAPGPSATVTGTGALSAVNILARGGRGAVLDPDRVITSNGGSSGGSVLAFGGGKGAGRSSDQFGAGQNGDNIGSQPSPGDMVHYFFRSSTPGGLAGATLNIVAGSAFAGVSGGAPAAERGSVLIRVYA